MTTGLYHKSKLFKLLFRVEFKSTLSTDAGPGGHYFGTLRQA